MSRSAKSRRAAFTLIELMLVLVILSLLGGIAVVGYSQYRRTANVEASKATVDQARKAVELYFNDMSEYPTDDVGLTALIEPPADEAQRAKWKNGPYLINREIPKDTWGNELKYRTVTDSYGSPSFLIWSMGHDQQDGTDDDIRSSKVDVGM